MFQGECLKSPAKFNNSINRSKKFAITGTLQRLKNYYTSLILVHFFHKSFMKQLITYRYKN